jgi:hypothetical protein
MEIVHGARIYPHLQPLVIVAKLDICSIPKPPDRSAALRGKLSGPLKKILNQLARRVESFPFLTDLSQDICSWGFVLWLLGRLGQASHGAFNFGQTAVHGSDPVRELSLVLGQHRLNSLVYLVVSKRTMAG